MRVRGSRSAENERTVGATEPEGIGKRVLHRHRARGLRNVIQIASLAGLIQVDGRRRHLIAQRKHREDRLDAAGGALLAVALSFMLLALNRLRPPGPETALFAALAVAGIDDHHLLSAYLYSRAQSVMGGTSQIQKNIIASRILGLGA